MTDHQKLWRLVDELKKLAKRHGATRQEIHEVYVATGIQTGPTDYEQFKAEAKTEAKASNAQPAVAPETATNEEIEYLAWYLNEVKKSKTGKVK